ncbi:hypothetical protein [Jiangella asiatica]|uniref:Uncharacterized protein n=1 Tax=Jiangella asiatica TaxID=2530372 RepID=A0A4R5DKS2_9ACTN|nr:hypothetical protein [Jiangella asiatica]TDE12620.1 hypothetical protein E1269_07220 [Jiangella asiatica]
MPTETGRDQMVRSDAILAELDRGRAAAVGEASYEAFRQVFREVAEHQVDRRRSRSPAGSDVALMPRGRLR